MALTDIERENIIMAAKEDARAILKEVLAEHIANCPVGQELHEAIARWTGATWVLGVIVSIISLAALIISSVK